MIKMKGIISCVFFFSLVHLICSFDAKLDGLWKAYQIKHERKYSASEERIRRSIWEENAQQIALHNLEADQGLQYFRMELNKFSDKTYEELQAYRKCLNVRNVPKEIKEEEIYKPKCGKSCSSKLPKFVDWRKKGYVTEVKNQGDCGSYWAFSSTGSLEGQVKAKTGHLVSLSEQNLVDCSTKEGNEGCDGGWMEYAFQYVIDNEGIDTEKAYPYEAYDGECHFLRRGVGGNCTSYRKITPGSEEDLQTAVATIGPIAVAIDATEKFMNYRSGVFHDHLCSQQELDHAVLVVGYGSNNKTDYWIVKNSWGRDWGMDGYILMTRNQHNQCGIASHAVFPII